MPGLALVIVVVRNQQQFHVEDQLPGALVHQVQILPQLLSLSWLDRHRASSKLSVPCVDIHYKSYRKRYHAF